MGQIRSVLFGPWRHNALTIDDIPSAHARRQQARVHARPPALTNPHKPAHLSPRRVKQGIRFIAHTFDGLCPEVHKMAVEGIKQIIPGLICVTDLSALQYNLVKLNADFNVVAINGVTDYPIGVLDNAPVGTASVPAEASVTCFGVTKVKLGGTV